MKECINPLFWRFGWLVAKHNFIVKAVFIGGYRWINVCGKLYFRFKDY